MAVTNSKSSLGEYLFKQWIMQPCSLRARKDTFHVSNNNDATVDCLSGSTDEEVEPSPRVFLSTLKAAIEDSIVDKDKIGLPLSGGLDSSTLAVLARRTGKEVVAATYKYDQRAADYEGISNDYEFARMLCEREGIKLLTVEAELENLEVLKEVVKFMDSPIADPAIIPTYLVAKRIGGESSLLLSGHGSDEILGGYSTYQVAIKQSNYGKYVPNSFFAILKRFAVYKESNSPNGKRIKFYRDLVRFAEGAQYPFPFNHERYRSYFTIDEVNRLTGSTGWLAQYFDKLRCYMQFVEGKTTNLQTLQFLDFFGTLNSHNILYTRYACKAANVEVRFPFTDKRLARYCYHLPDRLKIDGKRQKVILRQAMRHMLPHEIIKRKPAGLAMPIRYWFSDDLDPIVDIIMSKNAKIRDYLNPHEIDTIVDLQVRKKSDNAMKIWILLTLELFLQKKSVSE